VNRMVKVIAGAVVIYAVYCALLFFVQRQVLFPRHMIPAPPTAGRRNPAHRALVAGNLLRHGSRRGICRRRQPKNRRRRSFRPRQRRADRLLANELGRFPEMGVGLLLVEFPGYGRSAGSPSQASIAERSPWPMTGCSAAGRRPRAHRAVRPFARRRVRFAIWRSRGRRRR